MIIIRSYATCIRACFVLVLAPWFLFANPDPNLRRVFSPYWTCADGYNSVVQLHNSLTAKALAVRPILLSPEGIRTELSPIEIGPLGNSSLDINHALRSMGLNVAQSGSAIFEYSHISGGALLVETEVVQTTKTLVYTVASVETGVSKADQHAVFWLPSAKAEAYVALQNTSSTTPLRVTLAFETPGQRLPFASFMLGPNASKLIEAPFASLWARNTGRSDLNGAIALIHDGPDGALNTSGWIADESTGYSTMMTFYDPAVHRGTSLYGTQVFVGERSDLLASGYPLNINSYLVLLNMSATAVQPRVHFVFESNGRTVQVPVAFGTLAPWQSAQADLGSLRQNGGIPAGVVGSIVVNYDGPDAALMGRVFGIASHATFGFYVPLETYAAPRLNEAYWTMEGDATSVLTVANFGDQPDRINIVLTYNGGTLALPKISLQPLQTTTLNVRELVGLPGNATFGGFKISGQSTRSKLVVKEHIISESLGISTPFYGSSPWVTAFNFTDAGFYDISALTVPPGYSATLYEQETWSDGEQGDDAATPSSSDTSVVTASVSGQNGFPVTVNAQSSGSAQVTATDTFPIDSQGHQQSFQAQTQVNVQSPGGVKYVNTTGTQSLGTSFCGAGKAGYRRDVTLQLMDQGTPPTRIPVAGITVADSISPGSPNQLGIGATATANTTTNVYGQWPDTYYVCSTGCPGTGQSNATQSWTANNTLLPRVNNIVYKCSSITIDGN